MEVEIKNEMHQLLKPNKNIEKLNIIDINKNASTINESASRSMKVLEKTANKWKSKLIRKLGQGGYGMVYEVLISNKRFALKLIDQQIKIEDQENKTFIRKRIDREIFYSLILNHKNCLKGISKLVLEEEGYTALLMQLAENNDLDYLIKLMMNNKVYRGTFIWSSSTQNKINSLDGDIFGHMNINISPREKQEFIEKIQSKVIEINSILEKPTVIFMRFFARQILEFLSFFSKSNLIHLDLKPKNILITKDLIIKITDFFTVIPKSDAKRLHNISTRNYMSPEYYLKLYELINEENIFKLDLYSCGCSLFKIFTCSDYIDKGDVKSKIIDMNYFIQRYEEVIKFNNFQLPPQLLDFLAGLLHPNIESRFDLTRALNHPFITDTPYLNFYYEINSKDSIKFLLELQKIEYSKFFMQRCNEDIFQDMINMQEAEENEFYEIIEETFE